jgi:hypothetical protein
MCSLLFYGLFLGGISFPASGAVIPNPVMKTGDALTDPENRVQCRLLQGVKCREIKVNFPGVP